MADEKQQTLSLFDGGTGDSQQDDELTEGGAENEQDDTAGCEPEAGCEDDSTPKPTGTGKNGGANKTRENKPAQAAKPAPTAATGKKFRYPFNVRYATDFLDLAGLVDGTEYTEAEVTDILIANGYTEFGDTRPAFHRSDATNTLVITIKGNQKGGHATIDWFVLMQVQRAFMHTFDLARTEDRLLIYTSEEGGLAVFSPPMIRQADEVECDMPLSIEVSGKFWDLTFDLHSHHRMGAFWSRKDNRNEVLLGPIYGVFSWKNDEPAWLFRRRTRTGFEDLPFDAVVTGG